MTLRFDIGLAALVVTLALGVATARAADSVDVVAVGQAVIFSGDKLAAKDKAIDDGLRKAVEQAVGTIVSSETVTQNFQLLSDKIYSQAKGYVKTYKVVEEAAREGNIFEVKLQVTVGTGNLRTDVDGVLAVLRAKNMPRVLVMVTEQQVGQSAPGFWWGDKSFKTSMDVTENAIISTWQPKGVRFVDRQSLVGKLSTGLTSSSAPDDRMVKEIAGKVGAEVVVRGDATAQDNGLTMGTQMHSIQVSVSLRAINTDTGNIIGTATVATAMLHINPSVGGTLALEKAGKQAADQLFAKMIDQWQKESTGAATIALKVNDIGKTANLKALKAFITNDIRGVQSVREKGYSKKLAELEVDIEGSAQDLATELEEKKFKGFKIEIDEVSANSVTASLSK
jgi:hypothetical protein